MFQGGVKFSTGGKSPRAFRPNGCNSRTDGIVRMKEDAVTALFFRPAFLAGLFLFDS